MAKTFDVDQQIESDAVHVPLKLKDGTTLQLRSRPLFTSVLTDVDKVGVKRRRELDRLEYPEFAQDLKTADDLTAPLEQRREAAARLEKRNEQRGQILERLTFDRLAVVLVNTDDGKPVDPDLLREHIPYRTADKLETMILFPDADGDSGNADGSEANPAAPTSSTD